METPSTTTTTAYGLLDTRALNEAEQSFDTRALLKMVEELDRFTIPARQDGGLRDQFLRLHGMSHSVINGARLSAPTGESLPELATDILFEVQEAIGMLQGWVKPLQTLQNLAARD
jgi:hypothetical protein